MSQNQQRTPQEIVESVMWGYLVPDKHYHSPLPDQLAPWYCYTIDGGHSIAVVVSSHVGAKMPGESYDEYLVPAPVKAVLRAGVTEVDGYLWCDLPYDIDIGLVVEDGDDEY